MPSGTKPRPTQGDVARRAMVSQATVSYVLSNNPSVTVPEDTRERVLAAARELGYVPNGAARALRTRKTMTIASIIPDITNPFYPWFERGIQDVSDRHGYELVVYNTDGLQQREQAAIDSILRTQVDGLIMAPFHPIESDLVRLLESGVRVVMLSQPRDLLSRLGVDSVSTSNEDAAADAVNHLLDLGHTRIAMIAGVVGTPPRERRAEGYRRALAAHQVVVEEQLIRAGEFAEQGGYEATREIARLNPRPTAIFAANDLMAIGAMQALRELGLSVPEDISLVGFDNISAAGLIHPGLTTIEQYPHALGMRCAELLFARLDGTNVGPAQHIVAPHTLIVRDSAKAITGENVPASERRRPGTSS